MMVVKFVVILVGTGSKFFFFYVARAVVGARSCFSCL